MKLKKIFNKIRLAMKKPKASTNENGWCMQDVWEWGNEARDIVAANQPKQKIKHGDNTIMLSKKEPIQLVFASDLM